MLLRNEGTCDLIHETYRLAVGKTLEVPRSIAQLWLRYRGVLEVKPLAKESVATAPKATKKRVTKK